MAYNDIDLKICPPCGENVGLPTKRGAKTNKRLAPPTPPNGGTPSTREGEDHPLVSTHQFRSKKLQQLARRMRRSLTPQEAKLWQQLKSKQLGVTFRRQYLIADKYIVDFICLKHKLIIEVDGSQHADNLQDVVRTAFLNQRGFRILRFWNHEIDTNLDGCLRLVKTKLQK